MAQNEAIASALNRVNAEAQAHIIYSEQISRADRELLLATGWLQEIIQGWYMLVRPDVATGDSAAWYANFWDFVRIYLTHRFGNEYCLGTEASLDLHIEQPTIPEQVIVIVKQGAGLRRLLYETSLLLYTESKNFPTETMQCQGIQVMTLAYALCKATPNYFQKHPRDAQLALKLIQTSAELSRIIIRYNFKAAAARLIGAYQFLQEDVMVTELKRDLTTVGMRVIAVNPFQDTPPLLANIRLKSPYVGRIHAMWKQAREDVVANFPSSPGLPNNTKAYMHALDEIYQYDAYNSLSIEGYQVTQGLIDQVRSNQWNPNMHDADARNALAAKGYYQAFLAVKQDVTRIVQGENAATIVRDRLPIWYQQLFQPFVQVGLIPQETLFGYRNDRVYIRNSIHAPPAKEAVLDAMEAFFECIANEPHSGVNAVLGHYFFVYIHPYMDGNGRIARFLMNVLLASGGYSWTVVRVSQRSQYINLLEATHSNFDLSNFARFIAEEMNSSITL